MATASVKRNRSTEAPNNDQPVDEEIVYYASLSLERRNAAALEMAQEIQAHHERVFCVISAAVSYLKESPDENPFARALVEVAEELMCDTGQNHRLVKCLKSAEAANV